MEAPPAVGRCSCIVMRGTWGRLWEQEMERNDGATFRARGMHSFFFGSKWHVEGFVNTVARFRPGALNDRNCDAPFFSCPSFLALDEGGICESTSLSRHRTNLSYTKPFTSCQFHSLPIVPHEPNTLKSHCHFYTFFYSFVSVSFAGPGLFDDQKLLSFYVSPSVLIRRQNLNAKIRSKKLEMHFSNFPFTSFGTNFLVMIREIENWIFSWNNCQIWTDTNLYSGFW